MSTPQSLPLLTHQTNYTPFSCSWLPLTSKILVCGSTSKGSGKLELLELNTETQLKFDLITSTEQTVGFKCLTLNHSFPSIPSVASGDYNGILKLHEISTFQCVYETKAHESIINTVDSIGLTGSAPEIVTGSRDGCVKIFDPRLNEPVAQLIPSDEKRDCWSVCFGNSFDQERCVAAGYDNGDLKLFDLRRNKVRWETNVCNGVVSLQFDRSDIEMNKLVVTTLESQFHIFDMRTYCDTEPHYASLCEKTGQKSTLWLVRHLPQNRDLFVTSGGNGSLALWKYEYPIKRTIEEKSPDNTIIRGNIGKVEQLQNSKITDQPIVSLDFHSDKKGLSVLTSLDQTIRIALFTKLSNI